MAKFTDDSVLDAALTKTATATRLSICSGQPANFAGIAAVSLGSYTLTPGAGNGDFSAIANGDVSGRKITVLAQTGNNASANGSATHIALDDGSTLLHVTTCPAKTVTSGEPFDTAAFDIEFADVTP